MSVSLFSSNKTILMITDDELCIYKSSATSVELIDTVAWANENFESQAIEIITEKCGRQPMLILNDMVEQHYRKEKMIKAGVGFADKASMLTRKLHVAFPNYPVKAALPLKEKIKKSENQLPADVYIFAAVPNSDQYNQTMSVASRSLVSVSSFCLLPIEASDMMSALAKKIAGNKKDKTAPWCVFMGQHHTGGLRQIVTKNGEIALTRMTPICDADNAEKWGNEVKREFDATMSYLLRFGYSQEEKLDVILISDTDPGDYFTSKMQDLGEATNLHTMTAHEAAKLIGIKLGQQDNTHFADPLHVAWNAKKSKPILAMRATKVDKVKRPRQIAAAASILLMLSACFFVYKLFENGQVLFTINDDLGLFKRKIQKLDVEYKSELAKKEEMGFDILLVQESIRTYESLEEGEIDLESFIREVGLAMGGEFRVDSVSINKATSKSGLAQNITNRFSGGKEASAKKPRYITNLRMSYPPTVDIVAGNREVVLLSEALAAQLNGYEARVTKLLKDYEYTEGIIVETGGDAQNNLNQDFLAEIVIEGPFEEAEQ